MHKALHVGAKQSMHSKCTSNMWVCALWQGCSARDVHLSSHAVHLLWMSASRCDCCASRMLCQPEDDMQCALLEVALHGYPGRNSSGQTRLTSCLCLQISAAFSGGSAIAVLAGGMLFCRYTGAGRRNFITALAALAASCFFILTK